MICRLEWNIWWSLNLRPSVVNVSASNDCPVPDITYPAVEEVHLFANHCDTFGIADAAD